MNNELIELLEAFKSGGSPVTYLPKINAALHSLQQAEPSESIEQAHMAGQADVGIDPSYSNARAYALQQAEPVAYAVFTGGGNIPIWSADLKETLRAEFGESLVPLYTAPAVKDSLTARTPQPAKAQEAEPVATVKARIEYDQGVVQFSADDWKALSALPAGTKLYTTPQPAKVQVPEWTEKMGEACEAYFRSFGYVVNLPSGFKWHKLHEAMLTAAPAAGEGEKS